MKLFKHAGNKFQAGFTLMEVLAAVVIFALFFLGFSLSLFSSKRNSEDLQYETVLMEIAENKINTILISPPNLNDSLTLSVKKEDIEDKELSDYYLTVEWKKLVLPNISDMMKLQNADSTNTGTTSSSQTVFQKVQEALNNAIWQVQVVSYHKPSGLSYVLSSWIKNKDKKISLGAGGPSAAPKPDQEKKAAGEANE
jgi:prepilin-type N-terminal cleavage/methylation domain-containing protein